mmetsp:Transcript_103603/g.268056  ORF Transcript_103603/g.268056 Transcript_103603/m.268056 type:complete len:228 (-) Transcript_103603:14-697(-)
MPSSVPEFKSLIQSSNSEADMPEPELEPHLKLSYEGSSSATPVSPLPGQSKADADGAPPAALGSTPAGKPPPKSCEKELPMPFQASCQELPPTWPCQEPVKELPPVEPFSGPSSMPVSSPSLPVVWRMLLPSSPCAAAARSAEPCAAIAADWASAIWTISCNCCICCCICCTAAMFGMPWTLKAFVASNPTLLPPWGLPSEPSPSCPPAGLPITLAVTTTGPSLSDA